MSVVVVIPCRLGSTRFPGKPLALIHGKPMIYHTWKRAMMCKSVSRVLVATDSCEIFNAAAGFGAMCVMTSAACATGTDRVRQVIAEMDADRRSRIRLVVNVQGDEPGLNPDHVDALVEMMLLEESQGISMGTVCCVIGSKEEALSRNVVKCVLQSNGGGKVLYFSRALIPHSKSGEWSPTTRYLRHIGLYAYRPQFLLDYSLLPPSLLEEEEGLEQLRALQAGHDIHAVLVNTHPLPGVDTPDDLVVVQRLMNDE